MIDFRGEVISIETIARVRRIIKDRSIGEEYAIDFTDDENFSNALNAKVNVAMVGASKVRHGVTSESLSHKWLISPEVTRSTVKNTIQKGIRTILHP